MTQLSRARRWGALVVLSASLFVVIMDMTILNIAMPELAGELHPTATQQLWIIDIYSLVLAGLLVSMAAIGDRWGRKRMLMLGYAIFAVASVLVLFADTANHVIAIRALLGVGGAMIMPTTLSLIRVIFTDAKERATALSVWAAVSGLGGAIGPLVGGLLLEHFSWHAAFLVNAPLMVIAVVAGIILLPESKVSNPGRWDAFAAVLSFVGMVLLVWSIKDFTAQASFAVPLAWAALLGAAVALFWFARRSMKSDAPLLDLRLFESRTFTAGIIAAFGSTFAMGASSLLIAQWMQLVDGASPIEAGLRMIPGAITAALASLAAPPLARLIGTRAVLAGGLGFAALGMFMLAIRPDNLTLTMVLACIALVGVGMGALSIASVLIMSGSPEDKAGNAGALEETSYELGATLGIAILGSISALLYRATMIGNGAITGVPAELAVEAENSLGAAVAIAEEIGHPGLAEHAAEAFVDSLQLAGLVGGVLMTVVAVTVFILTPKGTEAVGSH